MTKVYCSISKTVVFKNFVPKHGLKGVIDRDQMYLIICLDP
jgi:hypothetical protein